MQRRQLLTGMVALAAGGIGRGRLMAQDESRSAVGAGSCRLITQDVTGPFHIDRSLDRSNLIDGQNGMPLTLNFQVTDVMTCSPLPCA